MITHDEWLNLLNLDKKEAMTLQKNKFAVVHSSTGPGQLNKFALLENNPNCFILPQVTPPKSNKPKLIFSISEDSLYISRISSRSYDLLAASIVHGDVYIWPEPHILFSTVSPCQNMNDAISLIISQTKSLRFTTKEEILQALNTQGIPSNQYLIIDDNEYKRIVKEKFDIPTIIMMGKNNNQNLEKEFLSLTQKPPLYLEKDVICFDNFNHKMTLNAHKKISQDLSSDCESSFNQVNKLHIENLPNFNENEATLIGTCIKTVFPNLTKLSIPTFDFDIFSQSLENRFDDQSFTIKELILYQKSINQNQDEFNIQLNQLSNLTKLNLQIRKIDNTYYKKWTIDATKNFKLNTLSIQNGDNKSEGFVGKKAIRRVYIEVKTPPQCHLESLSLENYQDDLELIVSFNHPTNRLRSISIKGNVTINNATKTFFYCPLQYASITGSIQAEIARTIKEKKTMFYFMLTLLDTQNMNKVDCRGISDFANIVELKLSHSQQEIETCAVFLNKNNRMVVIDCTVSFPSKATFQN